MERDIIERLAIDHALGELDADTATLFEAYLSEHAEARTWAKPMSETCARTREVISRRASSCVADNRSPKTHRRWPVAINGWVLGRWAAVIFVALGIGIRLGRRPAPETRVARPLVVQAEPQPSARGWDRVLGGSEHGFWQAKVLAVTESKSYEPPRRTEVGLWDRYRQTRKEWSYE
jgi:anti-sigma factor RsiW